MKNIIALAAFAAVAACSQSETAPEVTEEAVESEASAVMALDGQPPAGAYVITEADGTVNQEVLNEDGTYTSTSPTGEVETGRWVQKSPEIFCTTKDEEGAEERCSTEQIDDDGVWTSVNPDGETVTVERVVAEASE